MSAPGTRASELLQATVAPQGPLGEPAPSADSGLIVDAWKELRRSPAFILVTCVLLVIVAMAIAPQMFAGWFGNGDPRVCNLVDSNGGPRSGHPFGFDRQGCDIYANVIYGGRPSMAIGFMVTGASFIVALILGSFAGFFGGWLDAVISRIADVFFGFPFMLGALVILMVLQSRNVLTVAAVLALFGWPYMTRVMRANVLRTSQADFVIASQALGASRLRTLMRHVVPNSITPLIVLSSLNVGGYIVTEAALTFLGVGLQYPAITWGLQLSAAQGSFPAYPHVLLFPALFLSVTVLCFVLLGDMLRDAFDPKGR